MVAQVNPRELKPGQQVAGWLIVRKISEGTYGGVYEVEKDGQRFAMKVACQPEHSGDPLKTDARARREVACLLQLNHRHIIRVWGYGRWPELRSGFLYIILDLVEGYTLGKWRERTFPTPHEVAVLFLKLFDALEHMHGRGVFHRDLSLRNIMVTQKGEPVIIDFGAADYAAAEEVTDAPLPPGTPRNRSPEALRFWNENRLNPKARYNFKATDDIFALGANLYDVLTDPTPERSKERPPLGGTVPPSSPFRLTQGRVPEELSAYAMTLIERDPEDRPAIAKDARRPLEELARYEGPEWRSTAVGPFAAQLPPEPAEAAPVPPAAGAAALDRPRRRWLRPVIIGPLALSILATVVAAFVLHRGATPESSPVARSTPLAPLPPAPVLAEKPTNPPARLPSVHPTQEEASPSMSQTENSPTLTQGVSDPQKEQRSRVLSKAERCALLVFSFAWVEAGCSSVQTQPDPERCPKEVMVAMGKELGWRVDVDSITITIDVTRGATPKIVRKPEETVAVFKDGPVTGALDEAQGKAPEGTLFDGHLWTTGDRIYGRYRQARLPDGRIVPVCIELDEAGELGIRKEEGSKPGAVIANRTVGAQITSLFR